MSSQPQWKNRRLAARALRVLARTKDLDPTLAAFELTLAPAAESFIESYDRLRVLSKRRRTEHTEGKEAVDALARSVRSSAGQIQALGLISGFVAGEFIDNPEVPDDVIADTTSFLDLLAEHTDVNPDSVPYLESLRADIGARLELAQTEWSEAEQASGEYQSTVEANRAAQRVLNAQLVAFRRSLASVLGTTHTEYRSLRANRISRQDPLDGSESQPNPQPEPDTSPEPDASEATPPPTTEPGDEAELEDDEAIAS